MTWGSFSSVFRVRYQEGYTHKPSSILGCFRLTSTLVLSQASDSLKFRSISTMEFLKILRPTCQTLNLDDLIL